MTDKRLIPDKTARVLLDAADLIEERGCWNGTLPMLNRALCAAMAIGEAALKLRSESTPYLHEAACSRLVKHLGIGPDTITIWNDHSDAATVIRELRAAAIAPAQADRIAA